VAATGIWALLRYAACVGLGSEDEVKLVNSLFENDGYNPLIRPVRNLSETVTVKFGLAMIQLINVVSHHNNNNNTCNKGKGNTHTHTHARARARAFNGPFSGTTQVSRYQKGKPIWILLKQETVSGTVAVAAAGPYASLHLAQM